MNSDTAKDIPFLIDSGQGTRQFYLLVMYYPVLWLNLNSSMNSARYEYVKSKATNVPKDDLPDAFYAWKHENWSIGDKWPIETYKQYCRKDKRGNIVYPHKMIDTLPPEASFNSLSNESIKHPFFINDLDPDDDKVVWKCDIYAMENPPDVWNTLNLFRLQTQIKCSIAAHTEKKTAWYDFRRKFIHGSRGVHLFRAYLQETPPAMKVWREEWNRIFREYSDIKAHFTRLAPADREPKKQKKETKPHKGPKKQKKETKPRKGQRSAAQVLNGLFLSSLLSRGFLPRSRMPPGP